MNKKDSLGTILIVDDTLEDLYFLSRLLTNNGYLVRASKSGREAIDSINTQLPDLILLDINMPDISGYEVCSILKANDKTDAVPVLFLSALSETEDKIRGFEVGAVDFISKPFMAEEVAVRIKTHLEISKLRSRLEIQTEELQSANEQLHVALNECRQSQEVKNRNGELVKLNAEKDKFLSIIAHDLKSPFNGWLGLTEIFANDIKSFAPEKLQEIGKELFNSASNIYKLLENLLEWSLAQKGSLEFNPKDIELSLIVSQVVSNMSTIPKQKQIKIVNQITKTQTIYADEKMLNTVIRNLLYNAIKFSNRGGKIILRADSPSKKIVEISVIDNGVGIAYKDIVRLFKIEEKVNNKGTEGELSTGLGLLLCKEFVEKHGGEIWVESEIDKGSTFTFSLPITIRTQL